MFRTALALAAVSVSGVAHASFSTCFDRADGQPLKNMRVTYATLWSYSELETNSSGCVTVPTAYGVNSASVTVHATNRVVQMVDAGLAVSRAMTVSSGRTYVPGVDHDVADRLRGYYESGLRGYGPFTGSSPVGGSLASGPYISADLGSWLVVTLPYVEPAPIGGIPPRLHLRSTDTSGSAPAHELAHALHISQWPASLKNELEIYYLGWLTTPNNTHSWSVPSTDVVAFVEAFGGVGEAFEASGSSDEADFLDIAHDMTADLRDDQPGDPTIEGVVFGILFDEFATRVGLDYAIDTYIDCEVLTLDEYAECIHDREGSTSDIFGALRESADVYGVQLAIAPAPWDWDYCNAGYRCDYGEGDCDVDNDCGSGLVCFQNVGVYYGQDSTMDVCEPPQGDWDKCTPEHPCRLGAGDCDTDADCLVGSHCAQNVGAAYGLDPTVDVCESNLFLYILQR